MKTTPFQTKVLIYLGVFFLLLPSALKLYTGETQRLIVASGKLTQAEFAETAILIFRHTPLDAHGLIINRPFPKAEIKKLPVYLQNKDIPLFYGGPVDTLQIAFVMQRSKDADGEDVLSVQPLERAIKDDPDYLKKVQASVRDGKDEYRIYLGYSGWGVFQLDNEFRKGVWASTKLNLNWVFYKGMTSREVWINALQEASSKRKPRNPGVI